MKFGLKQLLERSGALDSQETESVPIVKTPWCTICGESMVGDDNMHIFYDYLRRAHIHCWGAGRKNK